MSWKLGNVWGYIGIIEKTMETTIFLEGEAIAIIDRYHPSSNCRMSSLIVILSLNSNYRVVIISV